MFILKQVFIMIKKITILVLLFCISTINAQELWTRLANAENSFAKSELSLRKSTPSKFDIYSLNV